MLSLQSSCFMAPVLMWEIVVSTKMGHPQSARSRPFPGCRYLAARMNHPATAASGAASTALSTVL